MNASFLRGAALLMLGAVCASAQSRARADSLPWPMFGHLSLTQNRPAGEFAQNVGNAYGLFGGVAVGLDPVGFFRIRGSISAAGYGSETRKVPLSPTLGGRIDVDLTTDNRMWAGEFGAEVTYPKGPIQPYVHAGWGYNHFTTDSYVSDVGYDEDDDGRHFETNNFYDQTRTRVRGGGVRIRLKKLNRSDASVLLDIGATRYFGGRARYVTPGGIVDRADGTIAISPHESEIDFTQVRIGFTIGR